MVGLIGGSDGAGGDVSHELQKFASQLPSGLTRSSDIPITLYLIKRHVALVLGETAHILFDAAIISS